MSYSKKGVIVMRKIGSRGRGDREWRAGSFICGAQLDDSWCRSEDSQDAKTENQNIGYPPQASVRPLASLAEVRWVPSKGKRKEKGCLGDFEILQGNRKVILVDVDDGNHIDSDFEEWENLGLEDFPRNEAGQRRTYSDVLQGDG
ncbi:hypothetical protein BV22DRAFT_1044218 [Leucogyrophana mollusca]|uniref:Uncharacterized protein n=1 Tax=Leucogyrophana mollusca TaxID=85980 RepID=A0ACB8BTX6_9AGAM|nr:hypothetical protein BV22DRAFT_1044218 [Leucogyrophana mollusca]